VNERLAFASGYLFPATEPVRITEDLEVYRGSCPYALLSKSARYRAGIAFQYVLMVLAGARILLVDEADLLDIPNRAALLNFVMAIRQDIDTCLIFATSDRAMPSSSPDLQVWVIMDGQVQPLNQGFIFEDGEIIPNDERKAA
jgi:ABC-type dipeptide/oligopeptide/nickel transport system ATPase component